MSKIPLLKMEINSLCPKRSSSEVPLKLFLLLEYTLCLIFPLHPSSQVIMLWSCFWKILTGQQTKVIIMLAGANKIRKDTVVLELITRHGDHIRDVTLTPDSEGVRYTATLTSPSSPFKLKIKGTTKSGNPFERISRGVEEPKSIQLRIFYSGDEFTLKRGEISTVTFRLYNSARVNKRINIEVKDTLGFAGNPRRNNRTLRKGRRAFFRIEFTTPRNATVGAKDTALVSVNSGAERISLPVQLLVVE